jgi:hypothetical protein
MNWYATLDEVKTQLGVTGSGRDGALRLLIDGVSRWIDSPEGANRHFYVEQGTRYFDTGRSVEQLLIGDALTVSALTMDSELDGTFDGETWTEGTDFLLGPWNGYPKRWIERARATGNYCWPLGLQRYVKAVGYWGFGDGERSAPVDALGVTVTAADGSTTSATASASGTIQEGMTLLLGSEQAFVSGVSGTALTLKRGVNGTTGTAHAAAAASVYRYPGVIRQACIAMTAEAFRELGKEGMMSERILNYQYMRATPAHTRERNRRLLGGMIRRRNER